MHILRYLVRIELRRQIPPWETIEKDGMILHVCGHAFRGESRLSKEEVLRNLVAALDEHEGGIERFLRSLNGSFALVAKGADWALAAVDRLRSIPLFYRLEGQAVVIGDALRPEAIKSLAEDIDDVALLDFLHVGYATGDKTLHRQYRQVEAGQYLEVARNGEPGVKVGTYFSFLPNGAATDLRDFEERFEVIVAAAIRRTLSVADGRTIAIPLSGGWDSRLIAAMIRKLGYNKVWCFSYGPPGNGEVEVSRQVAEALGFRWHFTPYTSKLWRDFIISPWMQGYWTYSSNMASLPHFQDLAAAKKLIENVGQDELLFVPGHSGDFLAGSHIQETFWEKTHLTAEDVARVILERHYWFWPELLEVEDTAARLSQQIARKCGERLASEMASSAYELWDWSERQAKYIVNSVRAYEYIGSEWSIPLWDADLIHLFMSLPVRERIQQRRYITSIRDRVFTGCAARLRNIPIWGKGTPENWEFNVPKTPVRSMVRRVLHASGLLGPAKKLRSFIKPAALQPLGFHEWFSAGMAPSEKRFGEVSIWGVELARLKEVVQVYSHKRLAELDFLGILAFHVLAYLLSEKTSQVQGGKE